ncbi:hypothetical protein MHBO_003007, partial [Bonamia ostreae]
TNTDRKHISTIVKVVKNVKISRDSTKWHTEFSVEKSKLLQEYETGCTLCVAPRNDFWLVDKICRRFGWNKNLVFSIKSNGGLLDSRFCTKILNLFNEKSEKFLKSVKFSQNLTKDLKAFENPMTIKRALLWYFDLTHFPKMSLIKSLSNFVEDKAEKSIIEKLAKLDKNPEKKIVSVTYSLVGEDEPFGVCTKYLKNLRAEKDSAAVFLKQSSLRLPRKLDGAAIIMVGAGSGLAPFKGFVEHGAAEKERAGIGDWCLFFGCKSKKNDFIYESELLTAEKSGVLKHLFVAFSRDQINKIYVQDRIRENSGIVWKLLCKRRSFIFICGSTGMGLSVKTEIKRIVLDNLKSRKKADQFMEKLRDEKRIVSELWG